MVTPYAGVWIEILMLICLYQWALVTPYAGVWIEMTNYDLILKLITSLPTRECGLKSSALLISSTTICHSLRGSVD